jgi:photosystem II cytochrome c550
MESLLFRRRGQTRLPVKRLEDPAMILGDPDVGSDLKFLSKAVPPQDNILGLVEFFKEPMTYDSVSSPVETYPNTSRWGAYLFSVLRTLTEKDLVTLAGHMLIQPKVLS